MVLVLLLRNVTRKVVQPLETVPQVLAFVVYLQLDLRLPPVPLFHKTIPTYKIPGSLLCILIPVQSLILSTNVPIVSIILREFTTKANILHTAKLVVQGSVFTCSIITSIVAILVSIAIIFEKRVHLITSVMPQCM